MSWSQNSIPHSLYLSSHLMCLFGGPYLATLLLYPHSPSLQELGGLVLMRKIRVPLKQPYGLAFVSEEM
jgi:hypothetical protein